MTSEAIELAVLILAAAMLYSSVGHAGASGYLAAMALFALPADVMKPTALTLNIFVATIGTYRFARAGCFHWRLFWPFAALAVPLAFIGGATTLPGHLYKQIVGAILLFAAINLLLKREPRRGDALPAPLAQGGDAAKPTPPPLNPPPIWVGLVVGGALGLLAGMTGTGGGIFLSPLLLIARWADPRRTAGVSAAFILVNSTAGLAGQLVGVQPGTHAAPLAGLDALPHEIMLWAPAAVIGGLIGSYFGARRLGNPTIRRVLGVVLIIAGVKMIFA